MSYAKEFETVEAIVTSCAETRGVDAFALSLIKAERQARKLFTHLVFQSPAFGKADVASLRHVLADNRRIYFNGFLSGWDALYQRPVSDLIGRDYKRLLARLEEAIEHRNKIFHGQLTKKLLRRDDLLAYVAEIRSWCTSFADNAFREVGYDGFGRNSFRKSRTPGIWGRFRVQLQCLEDYRSFIHQHMERP